MSNPLWIRYTESTHGVNSNGHADVSNRPNRTIWANFTAQHNKDGTHKNDLASSPIDDKVWLMETGTYTGTGLARTITLSNSNISVKFVRIWSETYAYTWFATADLDSSNYSMSTQGNSLDTMITGMGVGEFYLGAGDNVNANGVTFYFVVYGKQDVEEPPPS